MFMVRDDAQNALCNRLERRRFDKSVRSVDECYGKREIIDGRQIYIMNF